LNAFYFSNVDFCFQKKHFSGKRAHSPENRNHQAAVPHHPRQVGLGLRQKKGAFARKFKDLNRKGCHQCQGRPHFTDPHPLMQIPEVPRAGWRNFKKESRLEIEKQSVRKHQNRISKRQNSL